MDADRFKQLVSRLELQSARAPAAYRLKVLGLTLLGFALLGALLAATGLGLLALVGLVAAIVFTGGKALLLLLKLGKLLIVLAIPLWYLLRSGIKALFVRLPVPQGREITRAEAPALFDALDRMRTQMQGPRFHHVLVVDDVNAAMVQRPAFGLFGWPRNYLLLGLPLLEGLPSEEALAVVAHEYGHLAGAHGRFSAFIYRLRITWGTVQAYAEHVEGWLGRIVVPSIRWYAPYFNAYTFVMARSDEYQADRAAAQLVGVEHATHALKRVNVLAPRHQRFMGQVFERIAHDASPPPDVLHRWAAEAATPLPGAEAERWLGRALDREGHYTDTHPTLRARLSALTPSDASVDDPPPAVAGPSAAQAWLGPLADTLRAEFQARWAEQVAAAWAERHAQAQQRRQRLAALQEQAERSVDDTLEMFKLQIDLAPQEDLRAPLAAFNAAHPDHALGLFLEGTVRLKHQEREGLALLERACALDPEATKPACQAAHDFLIELGDKAAAEPYAERWRQRDALETLRSHQLQHLDGQDRLTDHGLPLAAVAALQQCFEGKARDGIAEAYVARRVIPADPGTAQWVLGVRLGWWARQRGRQAEVVRRLSAMEWPLPLLIVTLDGRFAPWRRQLRALDGARLV